mmetsp:Transcript_34574/g.59285  ORF Transcript_34574/g.59285 Transcript_34574/m.59285 type:complete len:203 (-) Transcript_34574:214-822(-)
MKSSELEIISCRKNHGDASSASLMSTSRCRILAACSPRACTYCSKACCSCSCLRSFLVLGPLPDGRRTPSMRQPCVADEDMISLNCMYRSLVMPLSRSSAVAASESRASIFSSRSFRRFGLSTSDSKNVRVPILTSITQGETYLAVRSSMYSNASFSLSNARKHLGANISRGVPRSALYVRCSCAVPSLTRSASESLWNVPG